MAGKWFKNSDRLSWAFSEGYADAGNSPNPHPAGSEDADAWAQGAAQGQSGTCGKYYGVAGCGPHSEGSGGGGGPSGGWPVTITVVKGPGPREIIATVTGLPDRELALNTSNLDFSAAAGSTTVPPGASPRVVTMVLDDGPVSGGRIVVYANDNVTLDLVSDDQSPVIVMPPYVWPVVITLSYGGTNETIEASVAGKPASGLEVYFEDDNGNVPGTPVSPITVAPGASPRTVTFVCNAGYSGHVKVSAYVAGGSGNVSDPSTAIEIPGPPAKAASPAPAPIPTEEWVKADIVAWLLERGCTEPEGTLKGMLKADLLTMAESF